MISDKTGLEPGAELPIPERVMILFHDVAAGHMASTLAIKAAFAERYPKVEVEVVDLFAEIDRFPFNRFEDSWKQLSQSPRMEAVYEVLNGLTSNQVVNTLISKLVAARLLQPTHELVSKFDPQIIISTYLFTSALLREFKRVYGDQYFTASVAADLVDFPAPYADPYADMVIGATPESVLRYQSFGVRSENIAAPFFPIHPKTGNFRPKAEVLQELEFSPDLPVVLVTSGGLGISRIIPQLDLLANEESLQLIIIGGKDPEVVQSLQTRYAQNDRVRVLGFVNNLPDYIHLAKVVIGKPGPATIAEIEAHCAIDPTKRAILTGRVGIQEQGNIDFALQNDRFNYIGDDLDALIPAVYEGLNGQDVDAPPARFGFDGAIKMVEEIIRRYQLAKLRESEV